MNNSIVFNNLLRNSFSSKITAAGNLLLTARKSSSLTAGKSDSERRLVGEENFAVTDEVMEAVSTRWRNVIVQGVLGSSIFVKGHQASTGYKVFRSVYSGDLAISGFFTGARRAFSSYISQPIPGFGGGLFSAESSRIKPRVFDVLVAEDPKKAEGKLIVFSCDTSTTDKSSTGIIARVNDDGRTLFGNVLVDDLSPHFEPSESHFYETRGIKETLIEALVNGYKTHQIVVVCDNIPVVTVLNDPDLFWNRPRYVPTPKLEALQLEIQAILDLKTCFLYSPKIIGKVPKIFYGVDQWSKYGSHEDRNYLKSALRAFRKEQSRFPIKEREMNEHLRTPKQVSKQGKRF